MIPESPRKKFTGFTYMGRFDVHGNFKMFACGTRTALIALKDPKAVTKLVVKSVMIFTLVKNKRRLHDRKTEHFKSLTKNDHSSAIADHISATGHNLNKWDHFEILASGKTDYHCKIKETLFILDLKPAFNVKISSKKLTLY